MVADVWEKDVWEFQAKSGSSGSCRFSLHFLGKIAVQEMSGKTPLAKVYMGALKWGLKATLGNLRTIVYNCALLWPFWAPF